ncbi:MAG: 5-formyltetrahydrofolate cyclo-ligase [Rhodospirillaceae bacterium]|nr:5-formyltetrahydrofolate cyclo-ligase [Rhodospirillaceae bacterium]
MAGSIADTKRILRREALARRETQPNPGSAARKARGRLQSVLTPATGQVVSGYVAMRGELDPGPALLALENEGCRIALPYPVGKGRPLKFLAAPGARADAWDAYGIKAPPVEVEALVPDILIVPLAAFDREGYRLGYGGGFYDAAMAHLRSTKPLIAVGLAFAVQEVGTIPRQPHDARLDWIVTEREAIYISR